MFVEEKHIFRLTFDLCKVISDDGSKTYFDHTYNMLLTLYMPGVPIVTSAGLPSVPIGTNNRHQSTEGFALCITIDSCYKTHFQS